MNRTTRNAATALAVLLSISAVFSNMIADTVLGHVMYWNSEDISFDTTGWALIASEAIGDAQAGLKTPSQALPLFQQKSKKIYRLKNPSAVSLAILKSLGYDVFFLSQWNGFPSGSIKLAGQGQFEAQRIRSDFLWEWLAGADAKEKPKVAGTYEAIMKFGDGTYCRYAADALVCNAAKTIEGAADDIYLEFTGNHNQRVDMQRRIYTAYCIADSKAKPSKIIGDIEKEMDAMKLDISYKAPEFIPVK